MRAVVKAVALMAALLTAWSAAFAQDFPARAVNIIVPYSPGGTVDSLARIYAGKLATLWKVPVTVTNKPGAGMVIGLDFVAKSKPDGYTVIFAASSVGTIQHLYETLPFDLSRDFTYISLAANAPVALAVNAKLPAQTLPELIDLARTRPQKLTFSSPGNGTLPHVSMELLKSRAGVDMLHVPYKGASASLLAGVTGEVDVMFDGIYNLQPQVTAGTIRYLGVGSAKREASLPDVPAIAETYPGFLVMGWLGFMGPAGMPANVAQQWAQQIAAVSRMPDVVEQIHVAGAEATSSAPADFTRFVQEDIAKWGRIVTGAKIPKLQ
jgi:tripartite-type tricarboxylate transporter receptor subunit TctC